MGEILICDCCMRRFDRPVPHREARPLGYETIMGCPFCGGPYESVKED